MPSAPQMTLDDWLVVAQTVESTIGERLSRVIEKLQAIDESLEYIGSCLP